MMKFILIIFICFICLAIQLYIIEKRIKKLEKESPTVKRGVFQYEKR